MKLFGRSFWGASSSDEAIRLVIVLASSSNEALRLVIAVVF